MTPAHGVPALLSDAKSLGRALLGHLESYVRCCPVARGWVLRLAISSVTSLMDGGEGGGTAPSRHENAVTKKRGVLGRLHGSYAMRPIEWTKSFLSYSSYFLKAPLEARISPWAVIPPEG